MEEEIYINIKNCLSPDNETRQKGEQFIKDLKIFKLTYLLETLFKIFADAENNIPNDIKSLASILYKNILSENGIWINLSSVLKNKIREDLYNIIETSNDEEKIKYACIILSNIIFQECETNDIKNFKLIIKKVKNFIGQNNNKLIISYLYFIKIFFERFEEQKLLSIDIINDLQVILIPIIKNYVKGNENILKEKKLELALDIFKLILPFLKYSFTMETDYIFKPILDLMDKLNWEKNIYTKNLLVINDTINYYHRYIVNHIKIIINLLFDLFSKILSKINETNNSINNNSYIENVILFYLDIICLICDKELSDKTSLTNFFHTNYEKYISKLFLLLNNFPSFQPENESWNISKAVCYIISFIVNTSSLDSIIYKLLNYFNDNFNSISYEKKINAMLILSCILESKNYRTINDAIQNQILFIINKIDDKNDKIYAYVVSWVLGKISENIPSLYSKENFNNFVPKFINVINNKFENIKYSNEVRINICIVFGNLIKFYGDEKTKKDSNDFKLYYKFFINEFIENSFKEENIISGLSFYLLRVVMNGIQYSSKDLQQSLENIFLNILNKFDETNIFIKNNKNSQKINLDKVYKLQEYLCLILNQIFNKIIKKINIELCSKLYTSIINSFLNRNGNTYESGMLCLLNLVILLFNENTLNSLKNKSINIDVEIFYKLISAVLVNDDIDDDNKKKIAILCILNLIKINSFTCTKYIKELHQILKNMELKESLNEEIKNLIIKANENIEKSDIYKSVNQS